LSLCRATKDGGEEANTHRLLGEIHLLLGAHEEAKRHFSAALPLDKKIGRSGRIAQDLKGLAEAALQSGARSEAVRYLQRAQEVSAAAGDEAAAESFHAR